jgi:SAM-dependent methyltransferase
MAKDYFAGDVAEHYDEHIGELSDPEVIAPTADFLAALAQGRAALEFGIGTGRIALALAKRGLHVRGIDLSQDMVRKLHEKPGGDTIDVTIGDYACTKVGEKFGLVYIVFNTIMNLTTQEEQVAAFQNAAEHLDDGGYFVVEVITPDLQRLARGERVRTFAFTPEHLGLDEIEIATQRLNSHHYRLVDGRYELLSAPFRYVWPSELDLMARIADMSLHERWSDWNREPFTSDSTQHISVWQKVQRREG